MPLKRIRTLAVATLITLAISSTARAQGGDAFQFRLEEATISDVHRAIQEGQLTCLGLVEMYLDRAKAYNGVTNSWSL